MESEQSAAIIDTSAYIDLWQGMLAAEELQRACRGCIVRQSAVVLSELRRGARTRDGIRLVDALFNSVKTVWVPTADDWYDAGKLVLTLGDRVGWATPKRREFQNDALIALTARRRGAAVVTRNVRDFELLAKALRIRVLTV